MITIDPRVGSVDLCTELQAMGVAIKSEMLEFGDAAFEGNGPQGRVSVGIERKRIGDLLNSIRSKRFSGHQLPGLVHSYDYAWLFVEGSYRPNPQTAVLEHPRGGTWEEIHYGKGRGYMYAELDKWLTSIQVRTPVMVRRSFNRYETAIMIVDLYEWFQKAWDDHHAHVGVYNHNESVMPLKVPLARRVACQLEKIGWEKSALVSRAFPTVLDMAIATEQEWANIPGIGKVLSKRIVAELQGKPK